MNEPMRIDLFHLVSQESFEQVAEKIDEEQGEQGDGKLRRAMKVLAGSKLAAAMAEKFRELDLLLLFAQGWAQSLELKTEADKAPKVATTRNIRLGKFEHNIELFPVLTVSLAGFSSEPIKLLLQIQAEFEAVEVGVSKGYLIEVGGGFAKVSALLKYGQFSFPAGIPPYEWQIGSARKFEEPGLKISPRQKT